MGLTPYNYLNPIASHGNLLAKPITYNKNSFTGQKVDGSETHEMTFPLSLCLEMRVMKKSNCFLCPASIGTQDHIAYIEVLSTAGTPNYKEYFGEVATAWKALGGVPHWHKEFMILGNGIVDHMKKIFTAAKIKKFNDVRTRLDPKGIFLNDTMKKFFE